MTTGTRKYILQTDAIAAKMQRMAYEIAEQNAGAHSIILAGIAPNGVLIARQLQQRLSSIIDTPVTVVTLQLDKKRPSGVTVTPAVNFDAQTVIVTDDVSMTGKTMLYALKPMLEVVPQKIQTLVLVERQHKQFPMHSDYVGLHVSTTLQELIIVEAENDVLTGAYLE